MKFFTIAAVAASALSSTGGLVTARPLSVVVDKSHFEISVLGGTTVRIPQVRNNAAMKAHKGPRAVAKAYAKLGLEIPKDLQSLLQGILANIAIDVSGSQAPAGEQGGVAATPQLFDNEYLSAVQIGTPPQTLMLDFDTGSSDLWVFSSDTPPSEEAGQALYDVTASSTAQYANGSSWHISYGDGSEAGGVVYTDVVTIGGVTVKNQAVESATTVSGSFSTNNASSGLLGLAFDQINRVLPTPKKTFFSNAMSSLAMPLFTANLKKAEAGNYNFGFIDTTEFYGPITFVPVNDTKGFWAFEAEGYSIGSNASTVSMPHEAIADTGTTLLMLPQQAVDAYYSKVPSAHNDPEAGGIVFSCNETLPSYTAQIGSHRATVPGDLIKYAPADTESFATAKSCFGGIQSAAGLPFAIYGDIFLKSQFVVFHGGNKQLGFADKPL